LGQKIRILKYSEKPTNKTKNWWGKPAKLEILKEKNLEKTGEIPR
jgi:hypothetical protein